MTEPKVGIVGRGTIMQLARSMTRAKISECESDVRRAKYSSPDTFNPKDAPSTVHDDARAIRKLRAQVKRIEKRLADKGFSLDSNDRIRRRYDIVRAEQSQAHELRQARLKAAKELRENTLIALVAAPGAKEAAAILKTLQVKLKAI